MKRRASLHNLGCKVNAYETEAMQQMLEEAGYEIVPFGEDAQVCIINTCSVTNIADKKSRQMLHRAKAKNPQSVVVAAGCYVQAAAEELKKDGAVDIIIGNNKKKELVEILEEYFKRMEPEMQESEAVREPEAQESEAAREPEPESHVIDIAAARDYEDLHISRISGHTRAFIKVQDGCNQFCSYCIIPYTRGRVRSRKAEDVAAEIRELVSRGYKEVVLTGIHLSSYGLDFDGARSEESDWKSGTWEAGQMNLLELIQKVHEIPGLERIRLGSLEPRIVTREFAFALAALPKICPQFHLSLQSGCQETLKRMNRHYTPEEYRQGCAYLREAFDHPAITTDVIVGFPGETEEEFRTTKEFLQQIHFYEMHIFKYSRRGGTRAAVMPDQIPETVKGQRSDVLLKLEAEMSEEYRRSFLGKRNQVLLEEEIQIDGISYMTGFTKEYVKAAVPMENLGNPAGSFKGRIVNGTGVRMLNPEIMEFLPEF
ncbi:MAG: tRNA (N(6)-L-threonylcarbamoyladenosine(37)-C(2))-methylthiotransferase MtaB [Lachnospiraceae bacterium]|nr:tRNA (N(6)-L-threonylcarbamoyladenosine(37)-C(2))-methylthiotransferase MtaB [Lachnospiraceae bacterium]